MRLFSRPLSAGWSFKQADDPDDAWMPVPAVPSVVHTDLLANNKLKDPFVGLNELQAQWVGERAWTYRTNFHTPHVPEGASVVLAFDGLDTFANVRLDGTLILESDNMFLPHRVDVTRLVQAEGEHRLEIEFDSALLRGREIQKSHPDHKWITWNGEPGRLGVRKAQYHWGWDWGPVLMTAGIWREVRLEVFTARVADLWTDIQLARDHQSAQITAFAQVEAPNPTSYKVTFTLRLDGKEIARESAAVRDNGIAIAVITVDKPALWWPRGHGAQRLYELSVSVADGGDELHQLSKRIGIRMVEVVQQPDKYGKSFFFRINGVDIFCGGSCWIPADNFLPSVTRERYRRWIELMAAGHQVMVRVWGGGIYEDDAFYDACDELGIMVWQDFMFACGNYPTFPALLESIRKEAVANVRRLRHHPSIVLYVGNNEDYQVRESSGLTYNYEDKNREDWLRTNFPARYIYEEILLSVIEEESPGVFYHPGSPWGDGRPTTDPTVGDIHLWNVWHGPQERYQIYDSLGGRFNSEFGMEAFPHIQTIDYFVENEADRFPQSRVLDFHNKADGHERRLATYLVENVRTATDLETYAYLTQVIQAEAMMFGYRGWRRQWDDRRCGGALLWQLNDCWPAISWAIVDYFLRRKPAYYAVARVLSPIAVGVRRQHHDWSISHARPPKTSSFEVWAVSSRLDEVVASVELRFISVRTGREVRERILHENVRVKPNGTTDIILDGVIDHTVHPEPHVLAARLFIDGQVVARDVDWPQPLKYLDLSERGLEVRTAETTAEGEQTLVVTAEKPVKCLVFEERDGVEVSDSAMDIVPGDEQRVTVKGLKPADKPLTWRFLGQ